MKTQTLREAALMALEALRSLSNISDYDGNDIDVSEEINTLRAALEADNAPDPRQLAACKAERDELLATLEKLLPLHRTLLAECGLSSSPELVAARATIAKAKLSAGDTAEGSDEQRN